MGRNLNSRDLQCCWSSVITGLLCLVSQSVHAQMDPEPNPDHIFSVVGGSAPSGSIATLPIVYQNNSSSWVRGWSFGVEHDPAALEILGTSPSQDLVAVDIFFNSVSLLSNGLVVGVITEGFPGVSNDFLLPGTNTLIYAHYYVLMQQGSSTSLCFESNLGQPPHTSVTYVTPGPGGPQAHVPTQQCGSVQASAPIPSYRMTPIAGADNVVHVPTEAPSFGVNFRVAQPSGPQVAQVFSLDFGYLDVPQFAPIGVQAIGELAALNGGLGPEVLLLEAWDYGGFTGWRVLVHLDGLPPYVVPTPTVSFSPAQEVVRVEFAVNGTVPSGSSITVSGDTFFDPRGADCTNAAFIPFDNHEFQVSFYDSPVAQIRRGDCNDDGTFDIGDAIYGLSFLFASGLPPSCEDTCDTNDDGAVDIGDPIHGLTALFASGQLPPSPGPMVCGPDPSPDGLDCLVYVCQ